MYDSDCLIRSAKSAFGTMWSMKMENVPTVAYSTKLIGSKNTMLQNNPSHNQASSKVLVLRKLDM